MPTAQSIRQVFARAIRQKPGDRTVRVQAAQLVEAFGQRRAEELAGGPIDLASRRAAAQSRRESILSEMLAEKRELEELASAGHADSRNELKMLSQKIARLQAGRLHMADLVSVSVTDLRRALESAQTGSVESAGDFPEHDSETA